MRVEAILAGQFKRAEKIVEGQRLEIERITEALLRDGKLSAEEVHDLIVQQPRLKLVDEPDSRAG